MGLLAWFLCCLAAGSDSPVFWITMIAIFVNI